MISALTLFCDDIREETGGSVTIVGVAPDNIGVPGVPGMVPKFGIYTRISIPSDQKPPKAMQVLLRDPDGEDMILGVFTSDFLKKTCEEARERGNPIAGFISNAMASPFPVKTAGRFVAIVRVDKEELVSGTVNFEISEQPAESRSHPAIA